MTPHFTNEDFAALGAPQLVYVRPVKASEIIGSTPVETEPGQIVSPDQILYAVHGANGTRLAVTADRESAVAVAMAHEMAPVLVH
jgi:hypothetical protein